MVSFIDYETLQSYKKIQEVLFETLWMFTNHHYETLLMAIDFESIGKVIQLCVSS